MVNKKGQLEGRHIYFFVVFYAILLLLNGMLLDVAYENEINAGNIEPQGLSGVFGFFSYIGALIGFGFDYYPFWLNTIIFAPIGIVLIYALVLIIKDLIPFT